MKESLQYGENNEIILMAERRRNNVKSYNEKYLWLIMKMKIFENG